MAERKVPWTLVVSAVALLLCGALVAGYLRGMRGLVQAYYLAEYHAAPLAPGDLGQPPPAHRLGDVPWLAEGLAPPASGCLRMLAAQRGRLEPRSTLDFLMGTSWGASPIPGRTGFVPGQDPEVGFQRAAPQLGFTRRYLTTDGAEDFTRALRTFLAGGRAVRVALDRAYLLERSGLEVHGVVLVGYDAEGFEYYDPVCAEPTRCQPGERPPGAPGLRVSAERLLGAAASLSLALQYPWKYQLLVLEPAALAPALEATLTANARALVGRTGDGPSVGSVLVADTARALGTHGDGVVTPELVQGLALASAVRLTDVEALEALFPGRPGLEPALAALRQASEAYGRTRALLDRKELTQAVGALQAAAAADRAAGDALLKGP